VARALWCGAPVPRLRCACGDGRRSSRAHAWLDAGWRREPVGGDRPLWNGQRAPHPVHGHWTRRRPDRSQPRSLSERGRALPEPGLAGFRRCSRRRRSRRPGADRGRGRRERQGAVGRTDQLRGVTAILARRIIPCLDVRDGQVVKGVRFRDHRVVGDILELAARYRDAGADELVFYDITASPDGRTVERSWVSRVAKLLDIPFCVAGGIRSVAEAEQVLNAGAEKASVNSPALENLAL